MSPDPPKRRSRSLLDVLRQSEPLPETPRPSEEAESGLLAFLRSMPDFDIGSLPTPPPPPVIRDRWFKDQIVHIDGYVFERCRFDRCKLVTEFATFTFRQSYISPECQMLFAGPSLKVVKLILHHVAMRGRLVKLPREEGVFPTINADGTFTLE